jgi:hypothetical protein
MKICILSIGRSGSTSLYNVIRHHLKSEYYCISEPFNFSYNRVNKIEENQFDVITKKDNILIKTLIGHTPNGFDDEFFYDWIFDFFDKVIILDRLDIKLQTESFSYLIHKNNKTWHKKQFYDLSTVPTELINEWEKRLKSFKKIIKDLSIKHNKKIYYYEDIFVHNNMDIINEIFDYLEIKVNDNLINLFLLSDEYKVRMNKKNNLI